MQGGATDYGTSPLTRGKRDVSHIAPHNGRNIPAHAGKTGLRAPENRPGTEHPRSRGENSAMFRFSGLPMGTSPLTRGKPMGPGFEAIGERNIPAHAGKTHARIVSMPRVPEHPRSRGENRRDPDIAMLLGGTSPLTRGKHSQSAGA